MGDNIKVAVRVRPFSKRETDAKTVNIITMEREKTTITDPTGKTGTKDFIYDFSYWSHDGYNLRENGYMEPANDKYIDQAKVFHDLGVGMIDNAWKGYNCSIFAYGQTGSGKSYSIMGYGANKGIVPLVGEELFRGIREKKQQGISYQVKFSMIEIYNEEVRDLLNRKGTPTGGLRIRERSQGFYVENLTEVPVGGFEEIDMKIKQGNKERTLAATKMNDMSSRAHTIVTVEFSQCDLKANTTKTSRINLVDLAGSERAKQAGTEGDRFKEGTKINQSLSTLGNVIKNLCDKAAGKTVGPVSYRDSKLTMLLKNALGGNSKTVMLATISPADYNYESTMSTLRYADRAKAIRNVASVNVGSTAEIIQRLLREKEQLLEDLKNAKTMKLMYSDEELKRMREEQEREIERIKSEKSNLEAVWQQRLEQTKKELEERLREEQKEKLEKEKLPHLLNLNEDPSLTGKVYHPLKKDASVNIGNARCKPTPDVVLHGPSIAMRHAVLQNKGGKVTIKPVDGDILVNGKKLPGKEAKELKHNDSIAMRHAVLQNKGGKVTIKPVDGDILVNGKKLPGKEAKELKHNDRLLFGGSNLGLFVFKHPEQELQLKKQRKPILEVDFEYAQREIARNTKVQADVNSEDMFLKEQVVRLEQTVGEANAMAVKMNRPIRFEVVLVTAMCLGELNELSYVFVKATTINNGNEYLWARNDFLDRYAMMGTMYGKFEENDPTWDTKDETQDPFYEPPDTPTLIGVAFVSLQGLANMVALEDKYHIYDYKTKAAGYITVGIYPCDSKENETDALMVDQSIDLLGNDINFKIKITTATDLPKKYIQSWCKFNFYTDDESVRTQEAKGSNPNYQFSKTYKQHGVTKEFIEYLEDSQLAIQLFGRQDASRAPSWNYEQPETEFNRLCNEKDSKIEELRGRIADRDIKLNKIKSLVTGRKDQLSVDIRNIVEAGN